MLFTSIPDNRANQWALEFDCNSKNIKGMYIRATEPTLSSSQPSSPAAGISHRSSSPAAGISGDCSPHSFRRIPITIDLHLTICFLRESESEITMVASLKAWVYITSCLTTIEMPYPTCM
ncbi:hypothetical protein L2E82_39122 [Cichorium intybus]|uniref:Uncharacterized protein n=1 Tax=Cichorium intybus TaxID=13427 RepID=A0ACB9AHM0_CICIN|nr:hypothetical protein L2E82_39122 [Cichorium intybus]